MKKGKWNVMRTFVGAVASLWLACSSNVGTSTDPAGLESRGPTDMETSNAGIVQEFDDAVASAHYTSSAGDIIAELRPTALGAEPAYLLYVASMDLWVFRHGTLEQDLGDAKTLANPGWIAPTLETAAEHVHAFWLELAGGTTGEVLYQQAGGGGDCCEGRIPRRCTGTGGACLWMTEECGSCT